MSNKKKGATSRSYQKFGDVTLYDHANSDKKAHRFKKGNVINREKSFEVLGDELIEAGVRIRNRRRKQSEHDPDHVYSDYHIDIWFLISEHIDPEDVQTFAMICTKTSAVVTSAKFWFHLYRRHYDERIDLPIRLQPDCMVRLGGLRACVIRSLFYTYEPFTRRIKSIDDQDYLCLLKRECVGMWCRQEKSDWIFCYKFKQKMLKGSRCELSERKMKNNRKIEYFSDIFMNAEEGCQLLVVTTSSFRPLPVFYGQNSHLSNIVQSLAQGFTQYKLMLSFSDGRQNSLGSVMYDPIKNIKVLDWWNPNYYSFLL